MKNKKIIIAAALKHILNGIGQLRNAFPGKTFAIDGRLVGDIGEIVAALKYDIKLYNVQQARHDGMTSDGKKVQVKVTFKNSLTFRTIPDYYLGLKLFTDGSHEEIFNGPGQIIFERYKHRKGIGKILLSFPISELKKLSSNVSESKRIRLRK